MTKEEMISKYEDALRTMEKGLDDAESALWNLRGESLPRYELGKIRERVVELIHSLYRIRFDDTVEVAD